MLDVAIIGGGLCGLALAHSLQARRVDWALFEARPDLGGRVHTVHSAKGLALDLGPTWYWPTTQPSITRLIADLGLATLAQPDDGRVLLLDDPNRAPRALAFDAASGGLADDASAPARPGALHGGARRLAGGMAVLVDALAGRLPVDRMQRGQALKALVDRASHVELHLLHDGRARVLHARRVVLTLPPRLAAATLRFDPDLPAEVSNAMHATPTWMANAAKVALACSQPTWRAAGLSGNAWVTHPQAVLAEVFDAGLADNSNGAALAGFVALGAAQRPAFRRGLPLLVESQITMLFGADCAVDELHSRDWADEVYTCTDADRLQDTSPGAHPAYGDARLQQALWQGRLWFGGSETARQGGGYLEGALAAAARLRLRLTEAANDAPTAAPSAAPDNASLLAGFGSWVARRREGALQRYRDQVHLALSRQQDEQLTQRALLAALDSLYAEALAALAELPLRPVAEPLVAGRHGLTPQVLAPFLGLSDELLAEARRFNATSCALSNFPFEHQPSAAYVQTIRRDLAAAWTEFALRVNQLLCAGLPRPALARRPETA